MVCTVGRKRLSWVFLIAPCPPSSSSARVPYRSQQLLFIICAKAVSHSLHRASSPQNVLRCKTFWGPRYVIFFAAQAFCVVSCLLSIHLPPTRGYFQAFRCQNKPLPFNNICCRAKVMLPSVIFKRHGAKTSRSPLKTPVVGLRYSCSPCFPAN